MNNVLKSIAWVLVTLMYVSLIGTVLLGIIFLTTFDFLALVLCVGVGAFGFLCGFSGGHIESYVVDKQKAQWEEEHKDEIEENERKKIQEEIKERERLKLMNEDTKRKYNDFVNSVGEKNGMTIDEIKKLHWESPKISHSQITNVKNGVCPTCGASLVNGTCEYCGNHFENKDDVLILIYDDLFYGSKKYTFNNGKLVHIETKAKPLAQFLLRI